MWYDIKKQKKQKQVLSWVVCFLSLSLFRKDLPCWTGIKMASWAAGTWRSCIIRGCLWSTVLHHFFSQSCLHMMINFLVWYLNKWIIGGAGNLTSFVLNACTGSQQMMVKHLANLISITILNMAILMSWWNLTQDHCYFLCPYFITSCDTRGLLA